MDVPSYLLGKNAGGGGGSYTETDPIFSASPASEITTNDISNWDSKQDILQYSTMPTASADNLGKIVQYTGTTTATYTNGYFYQVVSDGQDPATYSWENIDVQESSGGASYTAGDGINITNDVISTKIRLDGNGSSTIEIGNSANAYGGNAIVIGGQQANYNALVIGLGANAFTGGSSVVIGNSSMSSSRNSIAIGASAKVLANSASSIALGTNASADQSNYFVAGSSSYPINKMDIYTSNGVKTMATEEFVTNYLTTVSGYDDTKTQVLKNVNGTLTWVDE